MQNFTSLASQLTLEEKIKMIHGVGFFRTEVVERLGIPSLHMSDGPNGVRQEFPDDSWQPVNDSGDQVSWLPSLTCLASTWNPRMSYHFGQILGSETRARGKDIILAPGINIKRTPLCGRNFEYMSEDPKLISALTLSLIRGIQENDVAACVKHFALNNQELDRMSVDVSVDEKTLHEIYLPAFYTALFEGGALSVMGAYNQFRGEFCCESQTLLIDILRDQWGYDGVVISDWGGVHHTEETALHGVDIEMSFTADFDDYKLADPLQKKIENGEIPEEAVDQKINRILTLMDRIHMGSPLRKRGCFNTPAHHDLLEKIAEEGIVLLKNEREHLPLSPAKKILVVGDNATRSHASGGGSSEINALYEITPLLGIRMVVGGNSDCRWLPGYYVDNENHVTGEVDWQADSLNLDYQKPENSSEWQNKVLPMRKKYLETVLSAVPDYDEVIFIGGLNHAFDVEGFDRTDMKLPYGQDDVISALADVTENLTVVLINGSPVEMPWIDKVHSLIQTSYMGMQGGEALAKILFGLVNPSGRLPETYPLRLEDTPAKVFHSYPGEIGADGVRHETYAEGPLVGYRYYTTKAVPVLFPFGYGLSYSRFSFHNFETSVKTMDGNGTIQVTVSFEIQNAQGMEGMETVQLYVGYPEDGQPEKILKAFSKISLKPAEKRREALILTQRDFASYSVETRHFIARQGRYRLYLGTSATDILYETEVELTKDYALRQDRVDTF